MKIVVASSADLSTCDVCEHARYVHYASGVPISKGKIFSHFPSRGEGEFTVEGTPNQVEVLRGEERDRASVPRRQAPDPGQGGCGPGAGLQSTTVCTLSSGPRGSVLLRSAGRGLLATQGEPLERQTHNVLFFSTVPASPYRRSAAYSLNV